MKKIISYIPTLGPIGYLPAPGTMATLATLPLVIFLRLHSTYALYAALCVGVFIFGIFIIQQTKDFFPAKDPACIVIDEVLGCLVAFSFVPITFFTLIFGFLLFRIFDIFKIGLIKKVEELPGAWGIMCDDLVAGILANIILQLLLVVVI